MIWRFARPDMCLAPVPLRVVPGRSTGCQGVGGAAAAVWWSERVRVYAPRRVQSRLLARQVSTADHAEDPGRENAMKHGAKRHPAHAYASFHVERASSSRWTPSTAMPAAAANVLLQLPMQAPASSAVARSATKNARSWAPRFPTRPRKGSTRPASVGVGIRVEKNGGDVTRALVGGGVSGLSKRTSPSGNRTCEARLITDARPEHVGSARKGTRGAADGARGRSRHRSAAPVRSLHWPVARRRISSKRSGRASTRANGTGRRRAATGGVVVRSDASNKASMGTPPSRP